MAKSVPNRVVDELTKYPYDPAKCTKKITVELDDEVMMSLSLMALRRGISINHLVCAILHLEIERFEAGRGRVRRKHQ